MSAREEILARVRAALSEAPEPVRPVLPTTADPDDRADPADRAGLVSLFAERVADHRAVVRRCSVDELAEVVGEVVADLRVVVPPGLSVPVPGARPDDGTLSALELDGYDAVVTEARVGIAETGTIVLDHQAGQGRRALTLVPDLHVCVVRSEQVVADVPDAVAHLDPSRPCTWISGPSATSDIELDRVEGVHGPRWLHVLLVD